jgi:aldehyde:ferredoxin oxidoreductase
MTYGYFGKYLLIDLTRNKIEEKSLDESLCRDFLGGYGLGARIVYSLQKAGVDPLGPFNTLGFVTGAITGTQAIGGSRYAVVGKSPLTGGWGDANSGGDFGPYLRFSGYDAIFFTGISEKPVYVFITNEKAEIRDASHLWGKDCYETEDILKNELGKDTGIACIGPAGEKLSLIAAIINNKGRAAARSGLGAVMGSKKLKALVVKGDRKIPVYDETKVAELRRKYLPLLTGPVNVFRDFGTPAMTEGNAKNGDSPVKNWDGVGTIDFPTAENIGGNVVISKREKKYACYRCPIGCGGHMKEGTGEYKYPAGTHKPEYETMGMLGTNCLNDNADSIIKVNHISNSYGLDTISLGATLAMLIDCYENGLITKKDTDGIEMTWGNHQSIVKMAENIAKREGCGASFADGTQKIAEKIKKGSEKYAINIGGQELAAHDSKYLYAFATAYRMDATPGRHTRCGAMNPPGLPLPPIPDDPKVFSGRGEAQKIGMAYNHVVEAIGMCQFVYGTFPDASVVYEFVNAVTGWDMDMNEALKTGERIAVIRHLFNIREGINPLKFHNPDRAAGKPPKKAGPLAGITLDEETLDREFCEAMDWDNKTTRPSQNKLKELGLYDITMDIRGE